MVCLLISGYIKQQATEDEIRIRFKFIGQVCSHIQGIGIWLSVALSVRLRCAKINVHALVVFISHGEIQMAVLQCHQ